ncbi:branched-chain amino acid ABC transporter permease [Halovulum dunhuangense]|uniref:Branched-chain amino acid ABC transporter permease n=1 Tax=Halovulum dunhuangense TaxID=1505036 RepID=A0A849L3C8_9RHOB|nr:branched-chain amino acid ABC transporter permease [Halovulum dunhuangense]NNU80856.1 branched-chain amino acid ABC transporter permease [Halovulum dunhuangense]
MRGETARSIALHGGLIAALVLGHFLLPEYHHGNLARIMVLAAYAIGYNILFGYTGLLSLGHAMFFAAGMYGLALGIRHLGLTPGPALLAGIAAGATLSLVVGLLALRTVGVAFMIVTLMFAQAVHLTILLAGRWTRGDEGFVIQPAQRNLWGIDLSQSDARYLAALALFVLTLALCLWLVRSRFGRVLVAVRENEERTRLLGYDTWAHKLGAVVISGTLSAAAGAAYALLFGYAGASFATVQYSILPLLWVLLGGAGTVVGPFLGTLFMFYLIDWASGVTSAYMLVAGVALVLLTLFAPQGMAGLVRARLWRGLP